jgi:cell division protein ZapA
MGHVTITLNSRTYRLRCGDGEEPRLLELAEDLRRRIDRLASEFGQVGDDRLLVMAALLIVDELLDARQALAAAAGAQAGAGVEGFPLAERPEERHAAQAASLSLPPASDGTQRPSPGRAPAPRRAVVRQSLSERLADVRDRASGEGEQSG